MMHNSLLIRDRLLEANNDQLHKERREPHRNVHPDPEARATEGEMRLEGPWSVESDGEFEGASEAVSDLRDFLLRLGVQIHTSSQRKITFNLSADEDIEGGAFKVDISEGNIRISASDIQGLWAGLVYLEREMALRRAPILPIGVIRRRPQWKVQISQAPYGSNYLVPDLSPEYLSDDAFRMLAHFGINGMTIYGDWLCYVNSERFPELNTPDYARNVAVLRDATQRAKKYGVRLYYVPVGPKLASDHPLFERVPSARGARIAQGLSSGARSVHNLCSSDPESVAFHSEVMGNLFEDVPDLGGLILIIGGESYYHCFMRPDINDVLSDAKTNCPRCSHRHAEDVVNGLLRATAEGVHRYNPDAPVMAWPYSAFRWSSDPAQLELVSSMPPEVSLLTTIDKDQWMEKDGYKKLIWDYSADYAGPADNTLKQAEVLRKRSMPLFIKTETALGLECPQYPYVPALWRLSEKWSNVRSLRPAGVLQSWMFFGMWGSRAEELGWWANWRPEVTVDVLLRKIAQRDFGPRAERAVEAWERMTEAVSHIPYIPTYFTGPEFIGPAHPLLFDPDEEVPEGFESLLYYLQENEETFSTTVKEVRQSLVMNELPSARIASIVRVEGNRDVWDIVLDEYEQAVSASERAFLALRDGLPEGSPGDEILKEEILLIELIHRTFLTTLHTIGFLRAREHLQRSGDDRHMRAMVEIARQELENTRSARHIFVEAPWLDLSRRVDGQFPSSLDMINAKIPLLQQALQRHS